MERELMYTKQSKNTLILNILKILEKYSDKDHRLKQQDIIDYLKSDYDMVVERKSITRNIDNLIEADYDINYDEEKRGTGKNKNVVRTNFYIEREFDDSELRFLIDGILFSKLMSYKQKKDLIKKLEGLSSKYFSKSLEKVETIKKSVINNDELFLNIETIAEAISKNKKISINYCQREIDKKLHLRKNADGTIKEYEINPYQMVAVNSRYYLVCVTNEYPTISNLRVDRIKNVKILDKPIERDKKYANYDIPKHVIEHIYMFHGESDIVKFKFDKFILNDVIDWFDEDINLSLCKDNKDWIEATVRVNLNAMKFWAMQYGEYVVVKEPKILIKSINGILNKMQKKYKGHL